MNNLFFGKTLNRKVASIFFITVFIRIGAQPTLNLYISSCGHKFAAKQVSRN